MAAASSWRPTSAADSLESWPLVDRVGYRLAWAAGGALCLVAGAIVLYMAVRGVQYLDPAQIVQPPTADIDQSRSGGFFDPLLGTVLLTILATLFAAPLGVATAIWLTEYGRPAGLARMVESGVEVVAGTPTIVLAIFGLLVFQQQFFGFLSLTAEGDAVLG
ncbi:MAG: ABC transporter permease, partial [Actinomycetota bacterium]|nr:ABC transporter permease [Actinomycetota bacterium]